jgi:secreted trypsin-like serine protease
MYYLGGPLQIGNHNNVPCTYTQIGVVSFGLKKCGTIGKPGNICNSFFYRQHSEIRSVILWDNMCQVVS